MTSEVTYAEVKFNKPKSSGTKSEPPAGKDWSCCPKSWGPFSSNCYFISNGANFWNDSEKECLRMNAHLLVINTKAEQDFITQKLETHYAYYMGLSDKTLPMGERHWQWVDQTPYNESVTFWHGGEPNNPNEHCVMLNAVSNKWGWNDSACNERHKFICKMMKIYL
uniref:C-type lectin domain family 4 member A n=1 Tax=Ovis aries TaxID=9940 RepID=A0AC11DCB2_SHEEP